MNKTREQHIPSTIDQENYLVLDVCPQATGEAVIVLYDKRPRIKKPWRLAYRSSDYYFETQEALEHYFVFRGWRRESM